MIPEGSDLFRLGLSLYEQIAEYAVPIAFAFGMCNMIVNTVLSAAFGGRMKIGGKS